MRAWLHARVLVQSLDVIILDDTIHEAAETIVVTLSDPRGVPIDTAKRQATITILANDVRPLHILLYDALRFTHASPCVCMFHLRLIAAK